jgi:hypothetical protein
LFVNGDLLVEDQRIRKWALQQLFDFAKVSTKYVVHQSDSASLSLAKTLAGEFRDRFEIDLSIVDASRLSEQNGSDAGVIVCAAVVGKGSQLLDISRQLRSFHKGPRLYLIGFQVAEVAEDLRLLVTNLSQSRDKNYEVRIYGSIAVGTQLLRSYSEEVARFYPTDLAERNIPEALRERAKLLGSDQSVTKRSLLPGLDSTESMKLRPGFVFWNSKPLEKEQDFQVEAIATIAIVLQKARDNPELLEEHRLASAAFRHVMLSPENFSRFNDGLLQSAFLRCARPSEIDYRGDATLSGFMRSLLLRCFARVGSESGEAALEFLAALVDGRLKLDESHRLQVLDAAKQVEARGGSLSKEFAFLLGSSQTGRDVPF